MGGIIGIIVLVIAVGSVVVIGGGLLLWLGPIALIIGGLALAGSGHLFFGVILMIIGGVAFFYIQGN